MYTFFVKNSRKVARTLDLVAPTPPGCQNRDMGLEDEMRAFIKAGLAHHDSTCPMPAKAILMNPANLELFGWDEIFGVPVQADDRVAPKRFRIHCDGSAFGIEDAVEAFASEPAPSEPVEVPSGPVEVPAGPTA